MRKIYKQLIVGIVVACAIGITSVFLPTQKNVQDEITGGRTGGEWTQKGSHIQPTKGGGVNVLIAGINKYLNFNTTSGSLGYGFRDNAGVMEFKSSGDDWTEFGTGSGGGAFYQLSDVNLTASGTGAVLYYNSSNEVVNLNAGSNGQVLTLTAGIPSWIAPAGGGAGGSGLWASTSDELVIYPVDTSNVTVLGNNATTSPWDGEKLQIIGGALIDTANMTSATTTYLGINGETFTDLTGTGLSNVAGVLTVTSIGDSFSTTTNDYWYNNTSGITPSNQITAGDHISWTSNTLNVADDWYDSLTDLTLADTQIYVGNGSNNPTATSTLSIDSAGKIGFGNGTDQMYYSQELGALAIGKDSHQNNVSGATLTGTFATHVDSGDYTRAGIGFERAENVAAGYGAILYGGRSRGTLASRTVVQDGDSLLNLIAVGRDNNDFAVAGSIGFEVDGTPGAGDMPGRIVFRTSPDGTETVTEKMVIKADGKVGIATSVPIYELDVNGTIRASKNLAVGPSPAPHSFRGVGDIWAEDSIKAMEGLYSESKPYGAGLEVSSNDLSTTYNNVIHADATLTAATQVITDTHASFDDSFESQFIRVISSTPSFTGAVGEITDVISSTVIAVSFATAGTDTIVDATGMSYVVYPHPNFFVGDNGAISASVGQNADAKFEVHIPDGRGFHGVYIEDTAGVDQHQALTVDVDSQGYDGIVALNLFMENASSTNASNGVQETMISMEGNGSNYSNSSLRFLDINLLGSGTDNDVDVIHMSNLPLTSHILHAGSPETLDASYYDNGDGTTASTTVAFNSTGSNVALFENDDSIIYISGEAGSEFTNIAFDLSTPGNRNILAEYYYCDGDDSWKTLPGVTDTTNGFKQSGTINFINPVDRGQCNEEMDSTAFPDTTAREYIAVKRTRNNYAGQKPIENLVSISGNGSYLYMDSYGLKPVGSQGAPYACTASVAGMSYYDATAVALLWCDGATWNEYAETTDITVHNNLSGIQGGTATEYYHLNSSEYTELNGWLDNVTLGSSGETTLPTLTVTGQTTLAHASSTMLTVSGNTYLATVSAGVWNGTAVGLQYGGTGINASGIAKGGLIAGTGSGAVGIFTVGTDGYVLQASSTATNGMAWVSTSTLGISGGGATLTGTTGQTAYFSDTNTTVGTSTIFINTDENVGIGTTTPETNLTVHGVTDTAVLDISDGNHGLRVIPGITTTTLQFY